MRILVVEDDRDVRTLLAVELASFVLLFAACGLDAISAISEEHELSGVVTDLDLGDGPDGFAVLRAARARHPGGARVLVTARSDLVVGGAAGELVDMVTTLTRYSYWGTGAVATHGSPYDQDASVPIIFYGPWVKPGRYNEFARTVDIGVTLAAIAGVKPTEKVDGVILKSAIR